MLPQPFSDLTRDCRTGIRAPASGASRFCLAPGGVYHAGYVTIPPVRSYRTLSPLPTKVGGLLSVALSFESPRLAVNQHHALWSSDFPPAVSRRRSPVLVEESRNCGLPSFRLILCEAFPINQDSGTLLTTFKRLVPHDAIVLLWWYFHAASAADLVFHLDDCDTSSPLHNSVEAA